jgi:hypothetical protein
MTEETEMSALGHTPKKRKTPPKTMWKAAPSLKPGKQLMDRLAAFSSDENAIAIRDAWKSKLIIRYATEEEWERRNDIEFIESVTPKYISDWFYAHRDAPAGAAGLEGEDE